VRRFVKRIQPDYVFVAAAKVGGIHANNTYRADFILDNLQIATNLIEACHRAEVERLLFLGSSCIYPRDCEQPIKEEYLLSGRLEHTNEPYALAKIAGVKLCEAFNEQYGTQYVAVMPTNLYGPNDNYDLQNSHVLPALLRKAHEAKVAGADRLIVWGSGRARREFLHVSDLADACVFLMEQGVNCGLYNIGTGQDVTIRELAERIKNVVGLDAELQFDDSKPDGTPRKLLDVSRMRAWGWQARIGLHEGLIAVYDDFRRRYDTPTRSSMAELHASL
jgi:GDP-L-fucose synthase